MRTTVSGCVWLLMIGLGVACSSKSTGGGGGGGAILGGSGGTSSTATDAGSTSTAGKTSSNTGGTASTGGGTGGTTGDACADAPIVCLDAKTASTCDPATGMDTTFDCAAESMPLGFVSNGCMMDAANGDHCTIDSFSDQGCVDGTAPWGVCHQLTENDALDIYIACYQNTNGLHDEMVCYAKYYDETAQTLDCVGASAECDALTMP